MNSLRHCFATMLWAGLTCGATTYPVCACSEAENLVENGAFQGVIANGVPAGWVVQAARSSLSPQIRTVDEAGRRFLHLAGGGNPECVGGVSCFAAITLGKTYWFRVRFRKSECVNPIRHLLFQVAVAGSARQIVEFHRLDDGWVEGETRVYFPGAGSVRAEVRLVYWLCAAGEVWIENVALVETDPVPPRRARIACTGGPETLEKYGLPAFRQALDVAGRAKVDLVLLPEYFAGEEVQEPLSGPSATNQPRPHLLAQSPRCRGSVA